MLLNNATFSFNLCYFLLLSCGRLTVWTILIACKCEHITKYFSLKDIIYFCCSLMQSFYVMLPLPPPHIFLVFQMVLQVAFGFGIFRNGCAHGRWLCLTPLQHSIRDKISQQMQRDITVCSAHAAFAKGDSYKPTSCLCAGLCGIANSKSCRK